MKKAAHLTENAARQRAAFLRAPSGVERMAAISELTRDLSCVAAPGPFLKHGSVQPQATEGRELLIRAGQEVEETEKIRRNTQLMN